MREIAHNLRPLQLDRLGLTKAIEAIVAVGRVGVALPADVDAIDGVFPKDAEINLYRIVQESLNNIVKHSGATAASLTVRRSRRGSDHGRGQRPGLRPAERTGRRTARVRLVGIAERARCSAADQVRPRPARHDDQHHVRPGGITMAADIRILIADDHPILRPGCARSSKPPQLGSSAKRTTARRRSS